MIQWASRRRCTEPSICYETYITPFAIAPPLHVTRNIDDLSLLLRSLQLLPESVATTAPETSVQMHGSLFKTRCLSCNYVKHGYEAHLAGVVQRLYKSQKKIHQYPHS